MRDLGIYPLVLSELLFGSRHLSNTAVDESRHSSRRRRRPPGRRRARPGTLRTTGVDALGLHSFDHFGETALSIAQAGLNGHQFRRFLFPTFNGADIAGDVVDAVRSVLQRLEQCGELGLGGDHPKIVAHFGGLVMLRCFG
jgi:hypothetical protein